MIIQIKRAVSKILKNFFLKLYQDDTKKLFNFFYKNLSKNKNLNKNKLIFFDVGAHKGETITRFKKYFNKNNLLEIHCFEPNKKLADILKDQNFKNVKINDYLLLDKINYENNFYSMSKSGASSVFKPEEEWLEMKKKKTNKEISYTLELVRSDTIDNYCSTNNIDNIDFLKIDTQGSEKNVLMGGSEMINKRKINFIEVEIILGQYYETETSFLQIESTLNNNYNLVLVDKMINLLRDKTSYINCLYMRKDYFSRLKYEK